MLKLDNNPSKVDAAFLKNGFKKASEVLVAHRDELNALNVFPVPDGDTGHNMSACVLEACRELDKIKYDTIKTVSNAIKTGTLMGARGNSGVILSQIFSGFFEVVLKNDKIDIPIFVKALKRANEVATGAVMRPVKGTILTLIEDLASYAQKHQNEFIDYKHLLDMLTKRAFRVVEKTREMMPKLKQAGVVDAGAKGLAYIFEGYYKYANGDTRIAIEKKGEQPQVSIETQMAVEELTFQYCTEFMARLFPGVEVDDIDALKKALDRLGDSMVLVHDTDILKGHIHTDHPGRVFEHALKYGELMKVKVDNMKEQHQEILIKQKTVLEEQTEDMSDYEEELNSQEHSTFMEPTTEKRAYAFVAVSPGEGISRILHEMNVDNIVFGGQTMNPSTADIANAIDKIEAQTVFILPNNSNIIMAAESAAKMKQSPEKNVVVLPTKSIQEGLASIIAFVEEASLEENLETMETALKEVLSISVTHAVRDSEINDETIRQGEYLFFAGKDLMAHTDTLENAVYRGMERINLDEYEIMTIFYGKDVEEEMVSHLAETLKERYEDLEISIYDGGQAHYPFYISLE
ncbi:MAG TPA: DAK2 domain-containing protein [Thermotogota bacterium]|nr:DAK2 domain-containing protein [Thermotogota bacterium]HRW34244.1 DAK2 domain-containing protein [Thermotogota bacterium]